MKMKITFYTVFFCTLIAFIIIFGGSRSSAYTWGKTFGKIDIETRGSKPRTDDNSEIIAGSTSPLIAPVQPTTAIDLCILPRVLNLNTSDKILVSWIRLPERYDPHDIASNSLQLSVPSCSLCAVIYPTWQFPVHQQYLTLFPQQDIINIIETLDMNLPGKVYLKIYGEMNDGTPFEALETIWIIKKEK